MASQRDIIAYFLKPENIDKLKDYPKIIKLITNNKTIPSALRLYVRNIAGITDKITEDFFSKSELAEIKKRVASAQAEGSMGNVPTSGLTSSSLGVKDQKSNVIGYSGNKLSTKGIFNDPETNIDMTLGQASFSIDDKGNIKVTDTHNFDRDAVGGGYKNPEYFPPKKITKKAVPHIDTYDNLKDYMDKPGYSGNTGYKKYENKSMRDLIQMIPNEALSYEQDETTRDLLSRATKAYKAGTIDSSQMARILGKLKGTDIPIEIDIGKITQTDKLKANPEFAEYIARDTKPEEGFYSYGKEYEDVGIPSEIRKQAQKYVNMATGGRVGYSKGSPEPLEIDDREKTIAFDLFQRLKDIEEQYTGERIVGDPSPLNLDPSDRRQGTLMADASTEMDQAPDSFLRPRRYDIIEGKELPAETLDDFDVMFRKPNATGGRVKLGSGSGVIDYGKKYLKYKDRPTQERLNKIIDDLTAGGAMTPDSALDLALKQIREE